MRGTHFLLTLHLLLIFSCTSSVDTDRPNVIIILTDQWRAESLGYAGDPNIKTPYLDKFSEQAINFSNAVTVSPVCTPFRASLLTGKFPTTTGMMLNDIYLPSEEYTMAEIFEDAGYKTGYIGKWHLDGHGRRNNVKPERRQGFQFWMADECCHNYDSCFYYENNDPEMKYWQGYSPFAKVNAAKNYLNEVNQQKDPFLLVLSLATPHFPHHTAPEKYKALYPKQDLKIKENIPVEKRTDRLYEELRGYYAHATATDEAIGGLLEKIRKLGLDKNSIIVFTADHGEMMGSHGLNWTQKQYPYDESVRIPFLVSHPFLKSKKSIKNKTPLTTPDILPTLLSLAGLEIPEEIEGENLSDVFLNPEKEKDRAVLISHPVPFAGQWDYPPYRAIRTMNFSYVKTPDGPLLLFDNSKDSLQMHNLVNDPKYSELQSEMDNVLQLKLNAIGDSIIRERKYYLKKFNLEPETKRYTYRYFEEDEADSPIL